MAVGVCSLNAETYLGSHDATLAHRHRNRVRCARVPASSSSAAGRCRSRAAVARAQRSPRPLLRRMPQRSRARGRRLVREPRPRGARSCTPTFGKPPCASSGRASCRRLASRGPSARCSTASPRRSRPASTRPGRERRIPARGRWRASIAPSTRTRSATSWRTTRKRSRARCRPMRPSRGSTITRLALGVSPTLLEGYATAAMQVEPPRRRRPHDGAWRDALHGRAGRRAARADRRLAARHARRLGRRAHIPARCRVRVRRRSGDTGRWLGKPDRCARLLRRAYRGRHVQRRARRRREFAAFSLARAGGSAANHRRARRRAALRRRQRAVLGRGRARRRGTGADDRRPVRCDGHRRHAEPARDLRVPAGFGRRRGAVRRANSLAARDARVSPPGRRRQRRARASCCGSTLWGARRAATSRSGSNTRCRDCSSTRGSCIDSSASPTSLPSAPSTGSTTSSSHRGCRSSCGAAFRTTSCSRSRPRAGSREPDVLAAQVDRMLADARSTALVENFASQWLLLRELDAVVPQDPEFDEDLRAAMRRETEFLFADLLREPRSVRSLLDADYTYLNERLAAHYGIDGVRGSQMRRVAWPAGQPTARPARSRQHSHGDVGAEPHVARRARPVAHAELARRESAEPAARRRGRSFRRGQRIGGARRRHGARAPGAAPRQSDLRRHATASWTRSGFALENFDLLGRWRDSEDGHAIDASAQMVDGTELRGPQDLRRALLARSDVFVAALTERLMTYALGRELEAEDMPAVRGVVARRRAGGPYAARARASDRRERLVPETREGRRRGTDAAR